MATISRVDAGAAISSAAEFAAPADAATSPSAASTASGSDPLFNYVAMHGMHSLKPANVADPSVAQSATETSLRSDPLMQEAHEVQQDTQVLEGKAKTAGNKDVTTNVWSEAAGAVIDGFVDLLRRR